VPVFVSTQQFWPFAQHVPMQQKVPLPQIVAPQQVSLLVAHL
jgi:hypothetical protein